MRTLIFLMSFYALLGCSNNDSGEVSPNQNSGQNNNQNNLMNNGEPVSEGYRIRTAETDFEKDGVVDQIDSYSYDDSGRLTEVRTTYPSDSTRTEEVITYRYENGQLVEVTDANSTVNLIYEMGNLIERSEPGVTGFVERYSYDAENRLTKIRGPSARTGDDCTPILPWNDFEIEIIYDGNQVAQIVTPDGRYVETFSYNTIGDLVSIVGVNDCGMFEDPERASLEITYNTARYPSSIVATFIEGFTGTIDVAVDELGLASGFVFSQARESGSTSAFLKSAVLTRNNLNLLTQIDSTVEVGPAGRNSNDSFIRTFTYEDKPCKKALSVNPIESILEPYYEALANSIGWNTCSFPQDDPEWYFANYRS